MKRIILTIVLTWTYCCIHGQITDTGNNVGIGTSSPNAKLHVVGQNTMFFSNTWENTLEMGRNSNEKLSINVEDYHVYFDLNQDSDNNGSHILYFRNLAQGTSSDNDIRFQTSSADRLAIKSNGNVGIGTTTPGSPLEIRQKEDSTSDRALTISEPNNSQVIRLHLADNANGEYGFFSLGGTTYLRGNGEPSTFDGSVAIGTTNAGSYMLAVNGNIRAKEIKVETGWADYVFSEDYDLPTLKEVERHIKQKGHLINIPSAKDVQKNGIQLGEMNRLLLEKIEELTLYILEQEERIKKQNGRVGILEEKLNRIID